MKTPTTVLLVVIAALLAANLFVNVPEAKAQPSLRAAAAPHVIQVVQGPSFDPRIFRLWSDGVIEEALFEGVDWTCEPISPGFGWRVIPEPPLGVRITRIYQGATLDPSNPLTLLRLRSDGVVEQNRLGGEVWCGWRTPPE